MKLIKLSFLSVGLLLSTVSIAADYVILISVDGLLPSAISQLGEKELPGFYRFQKEGSWTNNARTDYDYTRTLPNHSSIITARQVVGDNGHGQILNDMPDASTTLHNNTGEESYVSSIFDVAHDHGLSTAIYASKDKFILFKQSYADDNGHNDIIGEDNGNHKLDLYSFLSTNRTAQGLVNSFTTDLAERPFNLSMIHLVDTDSAGHGNNWQTGNYHGALKRIDSYLSSIFSAVETSSTLQGNTAIVLVADHGGTGRAHSDEKDPLNYTIPFYVWGAGVAEGLDLYELNENTRKNPLTSRPSYSNTPQPIRNGDAANLVLQLLDLPAIADKAAQINAKQDLNVSASVN